jgi:hypothetical protein
MKARVLVPATINGVPVNAGDIIEVDGNALKNLVRKGNVDAITSDEEPTEQPQEKKKTPKAKH